MNVPQVASLDLSREAHLREHPATRKEWTQKRYFNVVVERHRYTFSCSENVANFRINSSISFIDEVT